MESLNLLNLPCLSNKTNALTALVFGILLQALSPKCNSSVQFGRRGMSTVSRGRPTQIRVAHSTGQSGETMRLDTVDYGSQSDERKSETNNEEPQGQLTPARRAALDALEREFHELLNARPR